MENKSMSLYSKYPQTCLSAFENDDVFNVFKTLPDYTQVLEHVTVKFGQDYVDVIKRDNPHLLEEKYLSEFRKNDSIGGAQVEHYDGLSISPSTLRYIKVLSDLIKIFGDLTNFRIAEIGGGYGGQCKIIQDYFKVKDYHIVDLDCANKLSKKYLQRLNVSNVRFSTSDDLESNDYDLIISNYAYTELDTGLQDLYKNKIIDNSMNGYITCNFINGFVAGAVFPTYDKKTLLALKPNTEIISEEPLTGPTNFILVWKKLTT